MDNQELHELLCKAQRETALRARGDAFNAPDFYYRTSPNKGPPSKVSKSPSVSWLQDKPKMPTDKELLEAALERCRVLEAELAELRKSHDETLRSLGDE